MYGVDIQLIKLLINVWVMGKMLVREDRCQFIMEAEI